MSRTVHKNETRVEKINRYMALSKRELVIRLVDLEAEKIESHISLRERVDKL